MSIRMFLTINVGLITFLVLSFAGWYVQGDIATWHLLVMAAVAMFGLGMCVGFSAGERHGQSKAISDVQKDEIQP